MVGFSRPKRRPKPAYKTAGEGRRVVVVFGPPSSGVSTLVECLSSASESSCAVVPYLGRPSLPAILHAHGKHEVVFVDVDGGVFSVNDVQSFVDHGLVHAEKGAIIRIYVDDATINERAKDKEEGFVSVGELRVWSDELLPLEERIRTHSLNYFMIPNYDLEEAVKTLALRAGLTK